MSKLCNVAAPIISVNGIDINRSKMCHASNYTNMAERTVKYIVMHYTGNKKDTAGNNANYFMRANRKASAHYFVDDDSIWQSVDVNDAAWHCGGSVYYHNEARNNNSIGIEMCCTAGNYRIGTRALENSARLVAGLCRYLGITDIDKYVIRHYDVTHKECPNQMAGANNSEWMAFKNRIKAILNIETTTQPTSKVLAVGDQVKLVTGATYTSGKSIPAWLFKKTLYVRRIDGNNVVISTLKIGAVTGIVDKKYLIKNGSPVDNNVPYKVKVTAAVLNVRKGPSTSDDIVRTIKQGEVYTIVEENNGWGLLKSYVSNRSGWINLGYTKKV